MTFHPGRTEGLALGILYLVEAVIATGLLFALWPIGGIFAAGLIYSLFGILLAAAAGATTGLLAGARPAERR